MSASAVFDDARERFADLGIAMEVLGDGEGHHPEVKLSRGKAWETYSVVLPQQSNLAAILQQTRQFNDQRPLVLARDLHPRTASALRRMDIHYLDRAGNAMLAFGDVYIHIEGRRASPIAKPRHRGAISTPANIFSPRRSQVIFALITWPELIGGSVRAVARCAGTSVGIAQETLAMLHRMGLEPHQEPRAHNHLIDMWATSYPEGLGRKLALRSFTGDPSPNDIDLVGIRAWVSGEALAPNVVGQETLTLYLAQFEEQLALRNRWRQSDHPNIFLRRKFWHSPNEWDGTGLLGPATAPPLIVYADMLALEDPRIRAAAEKYREGHLGLTST